MRRLVYLFGAEGDCPSDHRTAFTFGVFLRLRFQSVAKKFRALLGMTSPFGAARSAAVLPPLMIYARTGWFDT